LRDDFDRANVTADKGLLFAYGRFFGEDMLKVLKTGKDLFSAWPFRTE